MDKQILNYNDFVTQLLEVGFSMGGGNSEGIYSIIPWNWNETPPYETPVSWHTGEAETDPWEWRMRVLDERKDIAYSKVFFKKSGYITKKWYPYFIAARRGNLLFDEAYQNGSISNYAKRIYEMISENGNLPVHALKLFLEVPKADKSKFDGALVELQMKLYITMCGRQQKLSKKGEQYGWSSTVFCKTEDFFEEEVFKKAEKISQIEAIDKITNQILCRNDKAENKKIMKFIKG